MGHFELAFCASAIADLFYKEVTIAWIRGTWGRFNGVKFLKLYNYRLTKFLETCDRE